MNHMHEMPGHGRQRKDHPTATDSPNTGPGTPTPTVKPRQTPQGHQKRVVKKNAAGMNNERGFRVGGRFASAATAEAVAAKLEQDKADRKIGGNMKGRKEVQATNTGTAAGYAN